MTKKENVKNIYSLSPLASGMLYHYLSDTTSSAYFQQMCFTITGQLNLKVFEDSWNELLKRHDVLRTIFVYKGVPEPLQIVLKERRMDFKYVDLRALTPDESNPEIWLEKDRNSPFNITKDTPMRITVLHTQDNHYEVIWSFHHILMDGWCTGIIQEEFLTIYNAMISKTSVTLPPVTQYSVYIKWLKQRNYNASAQYWNERLNGFLQSTPLPFKGTDYQQKPYLLKTVTIEADNQISSSLNKLASDSGVTVVSVIKALWAVLLGKYNSVTDVVFGLVVSGRPPEIPLVERMIGLFINTIPVRVTFSSKESFTELACRIYAESIETQSHEHHSLADIAASHLLKTALFDHILVFENYPEGSATPGVSIKENLNIQWKGFFEQTNYPLEISILTGKAIRFRFSFDANVYDENDIHRAINHLLQLAASACQNPYVSISKMDMLTQVERNKIIYTFNDTTAAFEKDSTVTDIFERQVLLNPDKTAVISDDKPVSFSQLNVMSNRIAHHLKNVLSVRAGDLVGIMTERTELLVGGILGILKSSAAYVPIDPVLPLKRILYIVEKSGCKVLLTSDKYVKEFSDIFPSAICNIGSIKEGETSNPIKGITPDSAAYVTYTSGSTGNPKGVMVTHSNVVSFSANMTGVFGLTHTDSIYALTTVIFDISVLELIESLLIGMTVVLSRDSEILSPPEMLRKLRESAVTALQITPSRLKLLLDDSDVDALSALRVLIIGGEPLPIDLFDRLKPLFSIVIPSSSQKHNEAARRKRRRRTFEYVEELLTMPTKLGDRMQLGISVFNVYGPTETTIWSTAKRLNDGVLNIGRPLLNESVYVLSSDGSLLPCKAAGEICIGGAGVSKGYYKQEQLTVEKFIENPHVPGELIYRTGDLGRWLSNGELECLGRTDDQLKIRGYRVEPGEIECRIKEHPFVKDAAVIATETDSTEKELTAFIILNNNEFNESELRDYLSQTLPDYMIPTGFEFIEKFPFTANGKIDRKTLALYRKSSKTITQDSFIAPRNHIETVTASIWQSLLGRERIGIKDNFFALGGHSLKAMLIMSKIHKELSIELTLREIMENPTVESLAQVLSRKAHSEFDEIRHVERVGAYPLSHAQRRMWVLEQIEGDAVAYNMTAAYLIEGEIDIPILYKSFKTLVDRHDLLKTTLLTTKTGPPMQTVNDSDGFSFDCVDILDAPDALKKARLMAEEESLKPMDLFKGPLFAVKLLLLSEKKRVLIIKAHHIVCDGWSFRIITSELMAIYETLLKGNKNPLVPLKINYRDFVAWQGSAVTVEKTQKDKQYWLDRFSVSEIVPLRLPIDFPRPHKQSFSGKTVNIQINPSLSERLLDIGKAHGTGAFSVFVTILKALLYRYTGQSDILLGTPVTGRAHPDLESQVGLFVNTVVIRDEISGSDNFITLLKKIKTTVAGAFDHKRYPFDLLVDDLSLARDISRHPIFDIMVVFDEIDDEAEKSSDVFGDGIVISELPFNYNVTKFDLTFHFTKKQGQITLNINYADALFMESTISIMAANFVTLAESFSKDPLSPLKHIKAVSDKETKTLLNDFAGFDAPFAHARSIVDMFIEKAAECAELPAIITKDGDIIYTELNRLTDSLAFTLTQQFNVKCGDIVAVILPRGRSLITALLGVLKAGAVYMPLDTNFPYERLDYVLRDSGCKLILTESTLPVYEHLRKTYEYIKVVDLLNLPVTETSDYQSVVSGGDLAYVIYTSGSTGRPKGVMVEHGGFVNMSTEQLRIFAVEQTDRVLQFASPSFDASMSEIFMALFAGAALVPIDEMSIKDPSKFTAFIKDYGVTVATIPPVYLQTLDTEALSTIKTVITAGEAANVGACLKIAQHSRCFNAYGPTETSVCATIHEISPKRSYLKSVPIGKPIANVYVYVLDDNMNLLPVGVTGEIYISGVCLARGYLNNESLTSEVFTDNPFKTGMRLYHTGDIGRWHHDGTLEFLGRKDDQVKIRGYRVEPLEVERVLSSFSKIKKATVVAIKSSDGMALAAYYTSNETLSVAAVKEHMRKTLPDYMIPAHFIELDALPTTISGKVDKKMLPSVGTVVLPAAKEHQKPCTELETEIASLWELVLGRGNARIYDNFFDIGGNSITAISLAIKLRERFNHKLPLTIVFEYQTINLQAMGIENVKSFNETVNANPLVVLNNDGELNVFFLPPLSGYAFVYRDVAKRLRGVTVYGLNYTASDDLLSRYTAEIQKVQNGSPCILVGHSVGGNLAFELSRSLGRTIVTDVILIDSYRRVKKSGYNKMQTEESLQQHYDSFLSQISYSAEAGELFLKENLVSKTIIRQMEHYAGFIDNMLNVDVTDSNLHLILAEDEITDDGRNGCHYLNRNWENSTKGIYLVYNGFGNHADMLSGLNAEKNISLIQGIIDSYSKVRQRQV
ncbi:MAG: amino acid adenylation domain-containing protein [Nitrospirae bacterium]|nr:amino acid adenylation domain-containing protein [Nitrospirota bacterium]MBF0536221.1 amino acid adenylation domain-containing protein [Nitrospirota bacterium]MBF0617328.1 amino acid adenylation domain-containing protein [Nitrospirota bacterium]